ncbi:MAG: PAS domain-containing sensor histidine kinase [Bacteroidetes bacterium]|nr:PAS domain-containing sensor histidine kinase [Bacteroidota bacterium]
MNTVNKTEKILLREIKSLKEKNAKLEKLIAENQSLPDLQKNYINVFNNAPISISIINRNGRTELLNKIFIKTFGYTLKDIPNSESWFKKAYPNKSYRDKVKASWARAVKYKNNNSSDLRSFKITCKSGVTKDIIFRLGNLDSERMILLLEDISNRNKMETALNESEERFKSLFENATVGIYRTTPEGFVLMANPAMLSMLGYNSFNEIKNLNVASIGYVNTADKINFHKLLNKFGEVKGLECQWWKKDKTKIYIRESAKAVKNKKGEIIYFEGIVEDITSKKKTETELQKHELKYRTLFNLSPSGILLSDLKGNIIASNPAFCNSLGYSLEEIVNKNVKVISAPENIKDIEKNLILLNEGKTLKHTVKDVSKNGGFRYMELHEKKIPINDSEYGILTVANDITDRKKFEEELIVAKENAEKSDRLKTEFLAQISHEIRTPINSILSFTSYLHDELKDSQINEMDNIFQIIHKAGNRITRTIDMLLNMSQLQTGTYDPVLKEIDLFKNVIQPIASGFTRLAISKNIKFIIDNKAKNAKTSGDEYTLNQIFDNLINNAFKYTVAGRIRISVGRTRSNKLYVKVSDTGIGISEEFLSDIFEPFSQEEQGYTRKFEGNGLGLALVKNYCQINNAKISVKSKKGKGTTFTVTFN